jgi:AbrB family looped-hinge helix DNA binding protein
MLEKSIVTTGGRVVIPYMLRRKLGIMKGTQVYRYEQDGEIVIRPITDDYIRRMAGFTGTNGKLLKALMQAKAKERKVRRRKHDTGN